MDCTLRPGFLLPAGFAAALVPVAAGAALPAAYADMIGGMGPKRLAEFTAGRRAAHRALARAGGADSPVARGRDGAPQWPKGWAGSITHDRGRALAVVCRAGFRIGVDLEDLTRTDTAPAAARLCLTAAERLAFDGPRATLCAFSAKEAVFKAMAAAAQDRFWLPAITLSRIDPHTLAWEIPKIGAQGTVSLCTTPRHVVALCIVKVAESEDGRV